MTNKHAEATGPFSSRSEERKVLIDQLRALSVTMGDVHKAADMLEADVKYQTYCSEYANVQANEALRYQKRITALERRLATEAQLVAAMETVLTISDRKHDAWDAAKAAIVAYHAALVPTTPAPFTEVTIKMLFDGLRNHPEAKHFSDFNYFTAGMTMAEEIFKRGKV